MLHPIPQRNGEGDLLVHSLDPNGSAFSAGVQASDVIEKVNGTNVVGEDMRQVERLIEGSAGSEATLTLTLLRGPTPANRARLEVRVKPATARMAYAPARMASIRALPGGEF